MPNESVQLAVTQSRRLLFFTGERNECYFFRYQVKYTNNPVVTFNSKPSTRPSLSGQASVEAVRRSLSMESPTLPTSEISETSFWVFNPNFPTEDPRSFSQARRKMITTRGLSCLKTRLKASLNAGSNTPHEMGSGEHAPWTTLVS